jgi:hypothetical protein
MSLLPPSSKGEHATATAAVLPCLCSRAHAADCSLRLCAQSAVLRPLRAVLGAFVAARSQNAAVEGTALQLDPAARRAPAGADRVRTAECALACMLLLLERCPVFELSQVRHTSLCRRRPCVVVC